MRKLNTELLKKTFFNLFKLKKDYRRYINILFLILWILIFNRYMFTNWYHVHFKFWGTTFFMLPVIGFLIQIIYPTIFGWLIQTWINSVYLFNYISSNTESYVYNFPVKWDLEDSVKAFQSDIILIVLYVIYVIFMIPGKEKRILNYFKSIIIKY